MARERVAKKKDKDEVFLSLSLSPERMNRRNGHRILKRRDSPLADPILLELELEESPIAREPIGNGERTQIADAVLRQCQAREAVVIAERLAEKNGALIAQSRLSEIELAEMGVEEEALRERPSAAGAQVIQTEAER